VLKRHTQLVFAPIYPPALFSSLKAWRPTKARCAGESRRAAPERATSPGANCGTPCSCFFRVALPHMSGGALEPWVSRVCGRVIIGKHISLCPLASSPPRTLVVYMEYFDSHSLSSRVVSRRLRRYPAHCVG
jgi:hypothetical protein